MDNYNDLIEMADYPLDCEYGLAVMWLHPERLPKILLTLGKYDGTIYKMPEKYTNYTFIFGQPLKEPITVPVIIFKNDLFINNDNITDLILSRYQSSIPSCAFKNMKNLKRIWIPKKVKTIFKDTFKGCDSLEEVYYEGTEEEFNKIDIYYKRYTVIPKLGIKDDIKVWYDEGNLPFIVAKKHFNAIRKDE